MKRIAYSLLVFTVLIVSACLNTTTESTINADGSGNVVSVIDMAGIFDLMDQMGKGPTEDDKMDKPIDSTIHMKDMLAQPEKEKGRPLTPEEKELYQNSTLHMEMDYEKKVLKFTVNSKFSNVSQLSLVRDIQKLAMDQSPVGNKNEEGAQPDMSESFGKPEASMVFTTKDGLIENAFVKEKYLVNEEDQKVIEAIDQMGPMLGESVIKLVYNLPRPAKNVTAGKYELSEDKKKVTISYNFFEVFKDPSIQSYKIEY